MMKSINLLSWRQEKHKELIGLVISLILTSFASAGLISLALSATMLLTANYYKNKLTCLYQKSRILEKQVSPLMQIQKAVNKDDELSIHRDFNNRYNQELLQLIIREANIEVPGIAWQSIMANSSMIKIDATASMDFYLKKYISVMDRNYKQTATINIPPKINGPIKFELERPW